MKNSWTPARNVMARIREVKPRGDSCKRNFAYRAHTEKADEKNTAAAPRTAASRKGTIENEKMPSGGNVHHFMKLFLLSPPLRSARSRGSPVRRDPPQLRIPRK